MNYFTHGRRFLADPYFVAGTALPDWLSIVDRKIRAKEKLAEPHLQAKSPELASLAAGVVQHHHDDGWFHQTRAFAELNLQFAVELRDILVQDEGFRPSFLGHILVELLLDDHLAEQTGLLEDYYDSLRKVDVSLINELAVHVCNRRCDKLSMLLPRFISERFLFDYATDAKLLWRLNHVMRRVNLPQLPDDVCRFLPSARQRVRERADELLSGENNPSPTERACALEQNDCP